MKNYRKIFKKEQSLKPNLGFGVGYV